jgi:formylglycine-generating enzyme required for sulfatase activity
VVLGLLPALACAAAQGEAEPAAVSVGVPAGVHAAASDGVNLKATLLVFRDACPDPQREGDAVKRDGPREPRDGEVRFQVSFASWESLLWPGPARPHCARVVYTATWGALPAGTLPAWQRAPETDGLRVAHADSEPFWLGPGQTLDLEFSDFSYGQDEQFLTTYDPDGDRVTSLDELRLGLRPRDHDDMEPPVPAAVLQAVQFRMGVDGGMSSEGPAVPAETGAMRVDVVEATNRQYRVCMGVLRDGRTPACTDPARPARVDGTPAVYLHAEETKPVVGLSHRQARAFCWARGMSLPTEMEWERAARVPGDGGVTWDYPWGPDAGPGLVDGGNPCTLGRFTLYDAQDFPRFCDGEWEPGPGPGLDAQGNPLRPQVNGLADLAGNVAEWTDDPYTPDLHDRLLVDQEPVPPDLTVFAVRGGSFQSGSRFVAGYARAGVEGVTPRDDVWGAVGVRCVGPP